MSTTNASKETKHQTHARTHTFHPSLTLFTTMLNSKIEEKIKGRIETRKGKKKNPDHARTQKQKWGKKQCLCAHSEAEKGGREKESKDGRQRNALEFI